MANQMTEVRLLAVPLENDYKHTLHFATAEAQAAYFLGRTISAKQDFSYQRKEGYIRYPMHFDDLQNCNYLMYRNSPYSSKWYYAFITKMEYRGDETTWIYFEIDVIQSYLFDYSFKPSFIEREHTSDDTIGKNTFPEGLETGEYICAHSESISELSDLRIVVAYSDFETDDGGMPGKRYNGLYSGMGYAAFLPNATSQLEAYLKMYDDAGKRDAINHMFMAPSFLTPLFSDEEDETFVIGSENPATITKEIGNFYKFGSYTPKNNKLKCFPFRYLMVSNNNGGSAIYHHEYFSDPAGNKDFKIYGALCPGCSIRLVPLEYKGVDENHEEGINLGKYPICNWASDVYTNWLTQNSVNVGIGIVTGVGQVIGGVAAAVGTAGFGAAIGGGMIASGVGTIAGQIAQVHQASLTPNQARGNTNAGDVITGMRQNTFTFYSMEIREEYARIIDEFFTMFGYKTNRVKIPNKGHRSSFWYTKTIDASIDGDIPGDDLQKIKNCYNAGITFWKDPANIGNYSVSNTII